MGLDDFAPFDTKPAPPVVQRSAPASSADDEDLFDFPVLVMRPGDADAAMRPSLSVRTSQSEIPDADIQALVREIGTRPANEHRASDALTDIAAAAAAGFADARAGSLTDLEPTRSLPLAPVEPSTPSPSVAARSVAASEPAPTFNAEPATPANTAVADEVDPTPRRAWRSIRLPKVRSSQLAAAAVCGLLLLNVIVFAVSWKTSRDFSASLESLRADLSSTTRGAQAQAADRTPAAASAPRPTSQPAEPAHPDSAAVEKPALHTALVALETFERTAIAVARQEIESSAFNAARIRLARLLAVADRIEASVRDDIEAQASFLVADSYRRQAQAHREVRR